MWCVIDVNDDINEMWIKKVDDWATRQKNSLN